MIEKSDLPGGIVGQVRVPTATRGVVPGLPPALVAMRPDTLLQALVMGVDREGHTLLQTPFGDLAATTRLSLPTGSSVMLKVLSNAAYAPLPADGGAAGQAAQKTPEFQARIVSVNGRPPDPAALLPTAASSGDAMPNERGALPAGYDILRAVPTGGERRSVAAPLSHTSAAPSAPPSMPSEAAIVNLSKGTQIEARVLELAPAASRFLPGLPFSSLAPAATSAFTPSLASADTLRVHVLATQVPVSPGTAASSALPLLQPQVAAVTTHPAFSGTVIGIESSETVLKTQVGILKLPVEVALPKGTQVLLEAVSMPSRPVEEMELSLREADPARILARLTGQESGLAQLALALRFIDAETGSRHLQRQFPQLDTFLAARALWFMHGVQRGDAEQWLHPEVRRVLENYQKRDVVARLGGDFTALRQCAGETTAGGWHMMLIPLLDGATMRYVRFYAKHRGKKNDHEREKAPDSRFLVEVTLESFGEMQMDGLFRREDSQPALELFVRSAQALAPEMQRNILAIFHNHLETFGIKGWLAFQVMPEFPVNPLALDGNLGEESILA